MGAHPSLLACHALLSALPPCGPTASLIHREDPPSGGTLTSDFRPPGQESLHSCCLRPMLVICDDGHRARTQGP